MNDKASPLYIVVLLRDYDRVKNYMDDIKFNFRNLIKRCDTARRKIITNDEDIIKFYSINSLLDGINADCVVSEPVPVISDEYWLLKQMVCRSEIKNPIWSFEEFENYLISKEALVESN